MGMIGIATRGIPKILDPLPGGTRLVDSIEFVVSWARANSLWPLVYGTACCAMEMMSAGSSRHDWARFGVEVARATPRQADLIVLAGTIVEKMGSRLVTLYEQMPGPKYVIAMGSCAISGGPFFYDSYSVVKGGDRLIPVDVYIPGCPPRPEALLYGIMELQKKIRTEGRRNPWQVRGINTMPVVDSFADGANRWQEEEQRREAFPEGSSKAVSSRQSSVSKPLRVDPLPEVPLRPAPVSGLTGDEILSGLAGRFASVRPLLPPASKGGADPGLQGTQELQCDRADFLSLMEFVQKHPELAFDLLLFVTAVDRSDHFELVVMLTSSSRGHKLQIRTHLDREHPEIDSLAQIHPGAAWHERETYELFGIRFSNHPDLRRLLLEDDFSGHPLRKDFHDPSRVVKRPY